MKGLRKWCWKAVANSLQFRLTPARRKLGFFGKGVQKQLQWQFDCRKYLFSKM